MVAEIIVVGEGGEPTGNLDRETRRTVLEQFVEICEEGVAVIAVTHDQQVTRYTDRTVTLIDGVLSAEADAAPTTGSVGGSAVASDTSDDGE